MLMMPIDKHILFSLPCSVHLVRGGGEEEKEMKTNFSTFFNHKFPITDPCLRVIKSVDRMCGSLRGGELKGHYIVVNNDRGEEEEIL